MNERNGLVRRRGRKHVAQTHVLETHRFTYIIIVWNVNARRDARRRKRQDLQAREVGRLELILLEFAAPGQLRHHVRRAGHKLAKRLSPFHVHHGHEALPLGAHARRVAVRLDEADIALDHRSEVLDPQLLALLERLQ